MPKSFVKIKVKPQRNIPRIPRLLKSRFFFLSHVSSSCAVTLSSGLSVKAAPSLRVPALGDLKEPGIQIEIR